MIMNRAFLPVLLALLFGLATAADKITANLFIVTYSPLLFNLTFSEPCILPNFQILLNEMAMNYEVVSNASQISSYYLISASQTQSEYTNDFLIEKYMLLFTEPLLAAGGQLNLNSYTLRGHTIKEEFNYVIRPMSEKDSHYYYQNQMSSLQDVSVAIATLVYFLAATTVLGSNAFNFMAIYCFIAIQSSMFTSLDYNIAYYLLFEPHQAGDDQFLSFVYICTPLIIIAFSLVLGLLSRAFLRPLAERSGFWNEVYYFFCYKLFLTCWQLMNVPLFINAVHLVQDPSHFSTIPPFFTKFYIYLAVVLNVLYCYSAYLNINPYCLQDRHQWMKYVKKSGKIRHFQMFEGYHICIDAESWWKRNYGFLLSTTKLLLMTMIGFSLVKVPNLFFQVFHLIFLFTIRPFRYDFFNFSNIAMQIFIVLFYLYRYIVYLYMAISEEVTTSMDVERILLSDIVLVCIIIFTFFCLGIYEFYERLKFFKINVQYFNSRENVPDKKSKLARKFELLTEKLPKDSMFEIPSLEQSSKKSKQKHRRKRSVEKRRKASKFLLEKNPNAEESKGKEELINQQREQKPYESRKKSRKGKVSLLHKIINFNDEK